MSVWRAASSLLLLTALGACTGDDDTGAPSTTTTVATTASTMVDTTTSTVPVEPAMRAECAANGIDADLDGDGSTDRVAVRWLNDGGVLAACLADGVVITEPGGVELLSVVDLDEDGRDEIVNGGTTACAAIGSLVVLLDGSLQHVRHEAGDLELRDGCEDPEVTGTSTWGCDDGRLVTWREDDVMWERMEWVVDGAMARLVDRAWGEGMPRDRPSLSSCTSNNTRRG